MHVSTAVLAQTGLGPIAAQLIGSHTIAHVPSRQLIHDFWQSHCGVMEMLTCPWVAGSGQDAVPADACGSSSSRVRIGEKARG